MDNYGTSLDIFSAALDAVRPENIIRNHVKIEDGILIIGKEKRELRKLENIYALGVGKASAAMAYALKDIMGDKLKKSLVVVKGGHFLDFKTDESIRVLEASHPIPEQNSADAAKESLKFLKEIKKDDLLIFLLSGGASSLWCDIPKGLTLSDIRLLNQIFVLSEASIDEINAVRKHFSYLKGGQMLKYCPDNTVSLIISDVPGDDLSVIGSGPTCPDSSTFQDVRKIFRKYKVEDRLTKRIVDYLNRGLKGLQKETPKKGNRVFDKVQNVIVASNKLALAGAARKARNLGYNVYINKNTMTGNTEVAAQTLVNSIFESDWEKPFCLIQGGETVIKVIGKGKGGRNMHFALKALQAISLRNQALKYSNIASWEILSCGTDGTDGPTDATGAVLNSEQFQLISKGNADINKYLNENDSYHFFEHFGGLVKTGPTQTNVMDIQLLIVN